VQGSIAFPEIVVPIVVLLRKSLKAAKNGSGNSGKDATLVKVLLERIEENAGWVERARKGVSFAPGKLGEVERWENDLRMKTEESPLGKYVRMQRKTREKRRKLMEKARKGEGEILEEE